MKVLVQYFHLPGRGEFYERVFTFPDANRPKTMDEAVTRSRAAVLRCWPTWVIGDAIEFSSLGTDEQCVEGKNWKVQWLPDDWRERAQSFISALEQATEAQLVKLYAERKGKLTVVPLTQRRAA